MRDMTTFLQRGIQVLTTSMLLMGLFTVPAFAAEYTVTTTDDEADGSESCLTANVSGAGGDDSNTDCSLREAISAANADTSGAHTITVPAGIYNLSVAGTGEDSNATGDLDMNNSSVSISLEGTGSTTTIRGQSIDRVFHIHDGEVSFNDLRIMGGDADSDNGGGVFNEGGLTVSFDNVYFGDNSATNGAGLYDNVNAGSTTISLTDVQFEENAATERGAGAAFASTSDITLTRVEFNDNFVQSTDATVGGAMFVSADTANTLTITDSIFRDNVIDDTDGSSTTGGAMYIGNYGEVIIDSTSFYRNTSDSNGSAIYRTGNSGDTMTIINSTFTDNDSGNDGGVIGFAGTGDTTMDIRFTTIVVEEGQIGITQIGSASKEMILKGVLLSGSTNVCNFAAGTVTSEGYNLEDGSSDCSAELIHAEDQLNATASVGSYSNTGGDTYTIPFSDWESSDAVDAVPSSECVDSSDVALIVDQRDYTRPTNSNCDIGAHEVDQTNPTVTITSNDSETNTLECNVDSWTDPGATASDNFDSTVSDASVLSGSVSVTTVGDYVITYQSDADYDGNTATLQRTVTVEDTVSPVITVAGLAATVEAGGTYTDAGATVTDTCDPSVSISTNNPVDEDTLGAYTVTYSASDASGNAATQKTRTVTVSDTTAPTLTLSGESTVAITVGATYTDAGATATDSFEGDLSEDIVVTGSVDTDTAGEYTLTYSVADSSGNEATTVSRSVTVLTAEDSDPENDVDSGEGDGSDDSEETLGNAVSRERLTGGRVQVTYEGGEQKVFQLFNINGKPKAVLHTNGDIIIAITKRYMRTFDAYTGERIDQVALFNKRQASTKMKRYNVYKNKPGQNNIVVLGRYKNTQKKKVSMRSFVVKNGGNIVRRNTQRITLNKNTQFSKLTTSKNRKNGKKARIRLVRKGKVVQAHKYRVTKKKGKILVPTN